MVRRNCDKMSQFLFHNLKFKRMFTSKVDKKTAQEANALLMNGVKLMEVAQKTGLSYPKVHYYRKKLVKAGALQPLNRTTKKRKVRVVNKDITTPSTMIDRSTSFKLIVNGTAVNVKNVKSIFVSPELVDIKY
jgi:hypothetical protein